MRTFLEKTFWRGEQRLASDVEGLARTLNDLPRRPPEENIPLVDSLRYAKTLLERVVATRNSVPAPSSEPVVRHDADVPRPPVERPLDDKLGEKLIGLADYAFAAMMEADGAEAALGRAIFQRAAGALAEAGVEVLNAGGPYQLDTQRIVDIRRTDDPAQDRIIHTTVRLGYRRDTRILRHQEVIILSQNDESGALDS